MSFKEAVEALNGGLDIHYEPPKRVELFDWSKYAAFGAHSAFERIIREKNTEIDTNVKISLSPKAENLTDYTLDIGIKPCTENNQLYFAIKYDLRNEKTEKITEVGTYFVDTDGVNIAGHSGHLPDYETFRAVVEANTAKAVDKIRELPKRSEPFTEIKANADSKFFIKMSPDKAKKIADTLDKNGVKFGGFIRDGKATITIDKADLERYQSLTSPDPPKAEKQAETSEKAPVRDAPAVSKTPKRTEQPKKPSVKAKSNTPKPKAKEEKDRKAPSRQ